MRLLPVDAISKARLSERGLDLELVEGAPDLERWLRVEMRGFHGRRRPEAELARLVRDASYRRTLAVRDRSWPEPAEPIGTTCSWIAPLSVPGAVGHGRALRAPQVAALAIGSVTVAPTHRRRGIARALLEAELRTAHSAGIPLATLTVSEATIYGRYGFAPAVRAVDLRVDARRAGWAGPDPVAEGRGIVRYAPIERLQHDARALFEAARSRTPGQMKADDALWAEVLHVTPTPEDVALAPHLRAIRYDDADGAIQGFALYRADELRDGEDVIPHRNVVTVLHLCAGTDDAYAALWHFLLGLDLIDRVVAPLRSVDEPLRWLLADERAMQVEHEYDHLWLRLLDVRAALEARGYAGRGRFAFHLTDPLGFAPARILLEVDGADARVVEVDAAAPDPAPGTPLVALSVAELSALYLGGVSAQTLARAGRITEGAPGDAALLDALFRSPVVPWLNIGF
jgi:predicted acetyltransferase